LVSNPEELAHFSNYNLQKAQSISSDCISKRVFDHICNF